jgi:hypothetical protein
MHALALLASLIGIIANLLLHVWADDTLAYIWWGIAGAVLAKKYIVDRETRAIGVNSEFAGNAFSDSFLT